jgi:predicted transcriptional regulator
LSSELSQRVIPAVPMLPTDEGTRKSWERVRRLLDVAREVEVVPIPDTLQAASWKADEDLASGQPPPPIGPVKRELVRLREEVAWSLRVAGHAQLRIAHCLGVSQPAVCKILRRVERRVLARLEADVRAVKAKQAAQLEYVLDQSLRAWKDSQERVHEQTTITRGTSGTGESIRSIQTRRAPGDPRFLMVALKALQSERELFGLNRSEALPQADGTTTIEAIRLETLTIRQGCGGGSFAGGVD